METFVDQRWTLDDAYAIYCALRDANILHWVVDSMEQDPTCDSFHDRYDAGERPNADA
jgi:hypothetical protein